MTWMGLKDLLFIESSGSTVYGSLTFVKPWVSAHLIVNDIFSVLALIGSIIFAQSVLINFIVTLLWWYDIRLIRSEISCWTWLCIRKGSNYVLMHSVTSSWSILGLVIIILYLLDVVAFELYVMNRLLFSSYFFIIVFFNAVLLDFLWLAPILVDFELMYLIINLFELETFLNLLMHFTK